MKRTIFIFTVALIMALACLSFTACGETHEEVTGTWAIVYRFTDKEGKEKIEYVNGEYIVFTEDTFTYYVQQGKEYKAEIQSSVKFRGNTSQSNKDTQGSTDLSLYSLNKFSSFYITLDKYGEDKDFGLKFCGNNCMTFGRYSSSNAVYAVLVKCENLGDVPSTVAVSNVSGNWVYKDGQKISNFNINSELFENYKKDNENGFYTLTSDWEKTTMLKNGIEYSLVRWKRIIFYTENDYIVEMITKEYKTADEKTTSVFESMTAYFRNNA